MKSAFHFELPAAFSLLIPVEIADAIYFLLGANRFVVFRILTSEKAVRLGNKVVWEVDVVSSVAGARLAWQGAVTHQNLHVSECRFDKYLH